MLDSGYDVLTGGTDNHMVLINVANSRAGLTGVVAQRCLEECSVIVDINELPYDKKPALVTSGIRLGTPIVTKRGMGVEQMNSISALIDAVLKRVKIISDIEYRIDESLKEQMRNKVNDLCSRFVMR
ncbi:Serine hydroxymethyltransferase [subsurface metagenome]